MCKGKELSKIKVAMFYALTATKGFSSHFFPPDQALQIDPLLLCSIEN
jgi:hypothetical protein